MPRKPSKSRNYWNEDTERYVKLYILEPDNLIKNIIFEKHIYKPLNKMIENIVYRYKLYEFQHIGIDDIKQQCMCHILEYTITKFDINSSYKAYSYFGTSVKRFLMQKQQELFKKYKNNISIGADLNDEYGGISDTPSKYRDNNILNDIKFSYEIDTVDKMKELYDKFIDELRFEIDLLNNNKDDLEVKDWLTFLESVISICKVDRNISYIENRVIFHNALREINKFSNSKNYKYMEMLVSKYNDYKKNFFNSLDF